MRALHVELGRPVRILELASGAGECSLALARDFARRRMPVEITGSDIVPVHVREATAAARARGIDVEFRVLDAFTLDATSGEWDLIFVAQSMHHFTPGQLARIIAGARAREARRFVGTDGVRSLWLLAFLAVSTTPMSLYMRSRAFSHDAVVSARRFFAEAELGLIARTAAPDDNVEVYTAHPGFSVLAVRA